MNEKYELVKYEQRDLTLLIYISQEEETAWLSKEQIAKLFNRSRSVISKHINNIYVEGILSKESTCAKYAHMPEGMSRSYETYLYNLDVVISIGYRVKSQNGILLEKWLKRHLINKHNNNDVIIYDNDGIRLDVTIDPTRETVWLSVSQIASLFDTSKDTIYLHIKNIFNEGEIDDSVTEDSSATHKEIIQVASDGKSYLTQLYNLDVILSVGYRVKGKKAIAFRRWATSVLKEYLIKGYAIDNSRTLVTYENYMNLINEVKNIDSRLSKLEGRTDFKEEMIFYNGEYFDARAFIKDILVKANNKIILIDPYLDIKALDYLKCKKSGVIAHVFMSSKSHLSKGDIKAFNQQYGNLIIETINTFHDRFIIIDNTEIYHLGTSLNYLAKRTFAITKMDSSFIDDVLIKLKQIT